jgi:hypothetical protein
MEIIITLDTMIFEILGEDSIELIFSKCAPSNIITFCLTSKKYYALLEGILNTLFVNYYGIKIYDALIKSSCNMDYIDFDKISDIKYKDADINKVKATTEIILFKYNNNTNINFSTYFKEDLMSYYNYVVNYEIFAEGKIKDKELYSKFINDYYVPSICKNHICNRSFISAIKNCDLNLLQFINIYKMYEICTYANLKLYKKFRKAFDSSYNVFDELPPEDNIDDNSISRTYILFSIDLLTNTSNNIRFKIYAVNQLFKYLYVIRDNINRYEPFKASIMTKIEDLQYIFSRKDIPKYLLRTIKETFDLVRTI